MTQDTETQGAEKDAESQARDEQAQDNQDTTEPTSEQENHRGQGKPRGSEGISRQTWRYYRTREETITTSIRMFVKQRAGLVKYLNREEVTVSVAIGRALDMFLKHEGIEVDDDIDALYGRKTDEQVQKGTNSKRRTP